MHIGRLEITRERLIIIFTAMIVALVLYSLGYRPPPPYMHRGLYLSLFMIITALMHWPKSKKGKIFLIIVTLLSVAGPLWLAISENRLLERLNRPGPAEMYIFPIFVIAFTFFILHVGSVGYVILGLFWAVILYLLLGHYIPGTFGHGYFPPDYIVHLLYTDVDIGISGSIVEVSVRLMAPFLIFASLLIVSGLGELFIALATWLAGNMTGGPAKVTVFSTAAYGMISGSSAADVAATGSFTIPMMIKVGYEPEQAAAIETLAGCGAPLMPPIMGIAVFLMVMLTGISYWQICIAAIVPVFLWYFTVFFIVHFYARRHRGQIKKWRPSTEEFMAVVRDKWHLIFAIPALIGGMVYFAVPEQGAFYAIIFLLLLTSLKKSTRLSAAKLGEWMKSFSNMFAPITILIVALSVFVSGLEGSGIHTKLGMLLMGGIHEWWLILLISYAIIIVLGMALNVAATYLASVAVLAPVLAELAGGNTMLWHLFIIQGAALSPITPPIALPAFVAARIAGADQMKTANRAVISALPLFLAPFAIFQKRLLLGEMVGTPLVNIAVGVAILCLGIIVFTAAKEGYFWRDLSRFERGLGLVCGIVIVQPFLDILSNAGIIAGILLIVFWVVSALIQKRRESRLKIESTPAG